MNLIYIAAPFRGPNAWVVAENIRRSERWVLPLAEGGFIGVSPHALFAHFDKALPDQFWLDATAEVMLKCDAVLRLPGASVGADGEVALARKAGLPVVHTIGIDPVPAVVKLAVAELRALLANRSLSELSTDPLLAALGSE